MCGGGKAFFKLGGGGGEAFFKVDGGGGRSIFSRQNLAHTQKSSKSSKIPESRYHIVQFLWQRFPGSIKVNTAYSQVFTHPSTNAQCCLTSVKGEKDVFRSEQGGRRIFQAGN